MLIKIDLEKVFDKVEWSFIKYSLTSLKFSQDLIDLIMSYISTTSTSILIKGSNTEPFKPSRGIFQGEPLSPYIFIICLEMLLRLILHEIDCCRWDPIKISPKSPLYLTFSLQMI